MNDEIKLTVLPEAASTMPEEFPLPEAGTPQFIDVGTVPWSKLPIAELSPQTWFAYEKFVGRDSTVFNVFDGNGRALFHVCEEEIAAFVVKALNVYVQAAMQTQTQS